MPSGVGGCDLSSSIVTDIVRKEMVVSTISWLISSESIQRPGIMFWMAIFGNFLKGG